MRRPDANARKVFPNLAIARPEKYRAPYSHELMEYSDRVRDVGARSGAQNRPGPLAKVGDANENELKYVVEKRLNACRFYYEGKLRTLIEAGEKLEIELKDRTYGFTLQRLTARCKGFLPDLLERTRGSLLDLRRNELAYATALAFFRKEHHRRDPPLFPVSQKAHFTMLATIALVEALFNIAFYGEFRGIFTAALIALGASLANVAVSAFAGTLWRFKNSIAVSVRCLGWFYFALWLPYVVYLNKFIASFRASLELAPTGAEDAIVLASQSAGQLTFSYPWHGLMQLDITSWFLLIFGLVVAVAALLKGYHADDPYPQYGTHVRRHLQARAKYLAAEKSLYETVDEFLSDAEKTILEIADAKRDAFAEFTEIAQAIQKTFSDYKIDANAILNDFGHLTAVYRGANRAARNTPAPPAFSAAPKLDMPELLVPLRWQKKGLEKQKANLQHLAREMQGACAKARKEVARLTRINRRVIRLVLRDVDKQCHRRREDS